MFSENNNCCLCCSAWSGQRKTMFQGKEAACATSRDTGKCTNRSCIKYGKTVEASNRNCRSFDKWNALK